MADEVVDIRKRIEEMRNEVSAAIIANREVRSAAQSLGHNSDISLATSSIEPTAGVAVSQPGHAASGSASPQPVSDTVVNTHKGLETALNMPAFQLNVRNQISNKLLLVVIGIQLLTNILLILMVWMKLG
jgi:hypothetical protein